MKWFKRKPAISEDEMKEVVLMSSIQRQIFFDKRLLAIDYKFIKRSILFQMWFLLLAIYGSYSGNTWYILAISLISVGYGIANVVLCLKYKKKLKKLRTLEIEEIPWWELKELGGWK